jgi:ketosteroid isomerase-like protein
MARVTKYLKMKNKLWLWFFGITLICSCSKKEQKPLNLSHEARQEIWEADVAMSEMAVKEGFHKALLMYGDDNLIKPEEGKHPILDKKTLEELWDGKDDFKNLSWVPLKADAARSGDLGYTFGNWKMVNEDTTYYGNYYTFWKKQGDGKWKWVLDAGNNTPESK